MACAGLESVSGFEPLSETSASRYMKLDTVPYYCTFTLIILWMPSALFVISLFFLSTDLHIIPYRGFAETFN